ncbi:LLM class oxidoreductase [Micromonospora fluostatini]|uniref:LLM class oxidoreductase n=1 Tax=Micromonospora sp. JCM 30529 TaxID=3421643 RepID=UPI003D1779BF
MTTDLTPPRVVGRHPALARLCGADLLTLGLELPLDNDWHRLATHTRLPSDGPPGVPDMSRHAEYARLADTSGFAALWLRDVPLYDPQFGDAGQVFDPFPYLGYLAGVTRRVVLGTAAIALPLRHPLHVAKMAATIDRLSGGRLLLGVATGDRPVEFPTFGVDFDTRAERLRDGVRAMRHAWRSGADAGPGQLRLLPTPTHDDAVPVVIAGRGGQDLAWIAEHLDAYVTYHRAPDQMRPVVDQWRAATTAPHHKPLFTTMVIDLDENPAAPTRPIRFGAHLGRHALVGYLRGLADAGVTHVALNLRPSRRPVDEVIQELAAEVLPHFPTPPGDHGAGSAGAGG